MGHRALEWSRISTWKSLKSGKICFEGQDGAWGPVINKFSTLIISLTCGSLKYRSILGGGRVLARKLVKVVVVRGAMSKLQFRSDVNSLKN